MELVVDAHHRAGFVVVDIRPAVPRVLGHSAQLGALAYSGRWISVKFSKSSPRAVTAVSSAMNSAVALQSSNLSCRSLVTQDFLDYCCGVGGYVGLGGDGLTGDLDGDLA